MKLHGDREMEGCCERKAIADKLAALSHPARIEILQHLAGVEACCCKEVVDRLDLAQSTVSQHLRVLVDAGLLRLTPERQRSRYEVDRAALAELSQTVGQLLVSCCAPPADKRAD
ncbi:metalloregulator ArsR/SmtB family transcription factor [Aquamicrobium sp. LC103]|uniref:ArsR/SmtB family transcription factor n=1 Tax=Aquamicrobium sp. LC103 TaxID=1120658 RepID=UPI00063EBF9C|nr:metalloregulator ArsR/SmtB family transcription factor [Aquamicrobium sp. LC103]TKT81330.1 helix-turn-helix transcriptional regulator [Aquamicrobium sp. LC103]